MTASLFLDDVLAWSAQVCIVAAVAACAALLLRHPRTRLLYWQAILVTILALPLVEPWNQTVIFFNHGVSISIQPRAIVGSSAAPGFIWHREYLLLLIAAGAAL